MELVELQPEWLSDDFFIFLCPHCKEIFLSCKKTKLSHSQQLELFIKRFGENEWNKHVMCKEDFAWSIAGDFTNLNVSPSIDASKSGLGHWHGNIQNGMIV